MAGGEGIPQTGQPASDPVLVRWDWEDPGSPPVPVADVRASFSSLAFSPDSRRLLGTSGTNAWVWDLQTGQEVTRFAGHRNSIFQGAFRSDGRLAVTASFDRSARVWEVATGTEVARFLHRDALFAARFGHGGTRLLTAGGDDAARLWDLESQNCLLVLRHNAKVVHADFSPSDKYLLTSCFDDVTRVWEVPPIPRLSRLAGTAVGEEERLLVHTNQAWHITDPTGGLGPSTGWTNISGVEFTAAPGGRFVLLAESKPTAGTGLVGLQAFSLANPEPLAVSPPLRLPAPGTRLTFALSPDAGWVVLLGPTNGGVWSLPDGRLAQPFPHGGYHAVFSPDGKRLAVGHQQAVDVWECSTWSKPISTIPIPADSQLASVEWDSSSRRLVTACTTASLHPLEAQVWNAVTGQSEGPPLHHRDGVLHAAFSHDGTRVVTCSEDFTAILWDPQSARQLTPPLRHGSQVFRAAFDEQDQFVVTVDRSGTVTLWQADSGERLAWSNLPPGVSGRQARLELIQPRAAGVSIGGNVHGQWTVLFQAGGEPGWKWNIPYYGGTLEELLQEARLRSGHQVDQTGGLAPQPRLVVEDLWRRR